MCYQAMKKQFDCILSKIYSIPLYKSGSMVCSHARLMYMRLMQNPYARLMRLNALTGFWLLIIPVWWSICLASLNVRHALYYMAISAVGALSMRSAGCIVNDIVDRRYDKHVSRTKARPLASGELSISAAFVALFALLSVALSMLVLLPIYTMKWAFILLILVVIYPFMKRYTHYAQVFLGLIFNTGVLLMWFAINPMASLIPVVLYFSAVIWTVAYDTVYAYQDAADDSKLGLKSLAIKLGPKANELLWTLYQLILLSLAIVGLARYMNLWFFVIMALLAYWFYPKVQTLNLNDNQECGKFFRLNVWFGTFVILAILVGMI